MLIRNEQIFVFFKDNTTANLCFHKLKKIVLKGQDIASNANDVVSNVKGMTSIGGVVKNFAEKYQNESKEKRDGKKSNK